jgi:hypothetical protein
MKGDRDSLRKHMEAIYMFCITNGIHANLPAIKKEPETKSDETK